MDRILSVAESHREIEIILASVFPEAGDVSSLTAQVTDLKTCLDSFRPFNPAQLQNLQEAWDIEYTYESNRIEGNTLTLQETYLVVCKGLTIGGKSLNEHLEAINHRDALDFIRGVASRAEPLTERVLLDIHRIILRAIDHENAGFYRRVPVRVAGSERAFPNPLKVPDHMADLFRDYEAQKDTLHPVLLAADLHHKLVWVHPFVDGNGRTARLLMNLVLLRNGYPVANISAERPNRTAYYDAIRQADEGHPDAFHRFILATEKAALFQWLAMLSPAIGEEEEPKGGYFFERIREAL